MNINLLDIKKPGITTIEIDNTPTNTTQNSAIFEERLVVGFSRKGVFNTITRIETVDDRRRVYGEIDEFLEKRGSFFHRMIDISLQQGPVLALNLLPVNNDSTTGDFVEYVSFSTTPQKTNVSNIKDLYSKFYERERLWKPSPDNFLSIINANTLTRDSILSFVNLSQEKYSIIVKKSSNVIQFDKYVSDYYSNVEVPLYLNPLDKISDYFVDIIILKGDFTDYAKLSVDPTYSKYFTINGLKPSALASLKNSRDFNVVLSTTGSLIPDILDGSGASYSIDSLINSYSSTLGLLCLINDDYLNSLSSEDLSTFDLVGHSILDESITEVDYLSYKFNLIENLEYVRKTTFTDIPTDYLTPLTPYQNSIGTKDYGLFSNRITLDGVTIQEDIYPKTSLVQMNNDDYGVIQSYITSSGNTTLTYTHPDKKSEGSFYYYVDGVSSNVVTIEGEHPDFDNMVGEYIYVTDNDNKNYFKVIDYLVDTGNSLTSITVEDHEDLELLNTNYKVTWGSGYKITGLSNVTITIDGSFSNLDDLTTANVLYLKSNSSKTGELEFVSYSVVDGATEIELISAELNGEDLFGTDNLEELINDYYCISFGSDGIRRPKVISDQANIISIPDKLIIDSDILFAYKGSTVYKDWESGKLTSGDIYYKEVTTPTTSVIPYYISIQKTIDLSNLDVLKIELYLDVNLSVRANDIISFGNKKKVGDTYQTVGASQIAFSSKIGNINKKIQVETTFDNNTRIRFNSVNGASLNVGDLINTTMDNKNYLSPILTKKKIIIGADIFYDVTVVRPVNLLLESSLYYVERYLKIDSYAPSYNLIGLDGFVLNSYHLPGDFLNKGEQLRKILGVIENTNLGEALADRNFMDYNYIIDTFDSLITNELEPKDILTRLAKKQSKSIAIINAPSILSLSRSVLPQPIFTDIENNLKVFDIRHMATGGNLEFGSDSLLTLPSEENGGKYTCVAFPNFNYRKGNGQTLLLPPSAHTGNLFVRRNNSDQPFRIAAGTSYGLLTDGRVIGIETINENDLEYLDPVGYNTFINKRGYGIMLYGNNTSYQSTNSALNKLHVRDMLNKVQRAIENVLTRYLFDNNTSRTRYLVSEDLNNLLFPLKGEAFYDYSVKVDDKNNTGAIINQNFGIVEVNIFPIAGMEKIINILTIDRLSGIQSSGFII